MCFTLFQLLESLIKNCGDVVHVFVAKKDVLHQMVKIVKKKKVLIVLNFTSTVSCSIYSKDHDSQPFFML